MTIRVWNVGQIVGGLIFLRPNAKFREADIAAVLTNMQPIPDPDPSQIWQVEVEVGKGPAARTIRLDLPGVLPRERAAETPIFISRFLVYFRERLFASERVPYDSQERDEIMLRVKKAVYEEQSEFISLKSAVANYEAAIKFQQSGPRRDPIPEDVKLLVWSRDGGACTRCGSRQDLHFDHIIPVAKGGGNTEANVQILCQACNLKKSDKIAIL